MGGLLYVSVCMWELSIVHEWKYLCVLAPHIEICESLRSHSICGLDQALHRRKRVEQ